MNSRHKKRFFENLDNIGSLDSDYHERVAKRALLAKRIRDMAKAKPPLPPVTTQESNRDLATNSLNNSLSSHYDTGYDNHQDSLSSLPCDSLVDESSPLSLAQWSTRHREKARLRARGTRDVSMGASMSIPFHAPPDSVPELCDDPRLSLASQDKRDNSGTVARSSVAPAPNVPDRVSSHLPDAYQISDAKRNCLCSTHSDDKEPSLDLSRTASSILYRPFVAWVAHTPTATTSDTTATRDAHALTAWLCLTRQCSPYTRALVTASASTSSEWSSRVWSSLQGDSSNSTSLSSLPQIRGLARRWTLYQQLVAVYGISPRLAIRLCDNWVGDLTLPSSYQPLQVLLDTLSTANKGKQSSRQRRASHIGTPRPSLSYSQADNSCPHSQITSDLDARSLWSSVIEIGYPKDASNTHTESDGISSIPLTTCVTLAQCHAIVTALTRLVSPLLHTHDTLAAHYTSREKGDTNLNVSLRLAPANSHSRPQLNTGLNAVPVLIAYPLPPSHTTTTTCDNSGCLGADIVDAIVTVLTSQRVIPPRALILHDHARIVTRVHWRERAMVLDVCVVPEMNAMACQSVMAPRDSVHLRADGNDDSRLEQAAVACSCIPIDDPT